MPESISIAISETVEKDSALRRFVTGISEGIVRDASLFINSSESFVGVPNVPFAYWATNRVRDRFRILPSLGGEGRCAKAGLCTGDDFRFLRLAWEFPITVDADQWRKFSKGGPYSQFYSEIHLVVNWADGGREIQVGAAQKTVRGARPQNIEFFGRPGLTWSLRTAKGISFRILPAGCIFGHKGPAAFTPDLPAWLGLMNSRPFKSLLGLHMAVGSYEIGVINRNPVPVSLPAEMSSLATRAFCERRIAACAEETSQYFVLPVGVGDVKRTVAEATSEWVEQARKRTDAVTLVQTRLDALSMGLYGFDSGDVQCLETALAGQGFGVVADEEDEMEAGDCLTEEAVAAGLVSWIVGACFGRWDVRVAMDVSLVPELPDPFEPLPACPPGMLVGPDGLPAECDRIVSEGWLRIRPHAGALPPEGSVKNPIVSGSSYPLRISWNGILVDDPGRSEDIVRRVQECLGLVWKARADSVEQDVCEVLGVKTLCDYFRKPTGFFGDHLRRYSKSRRQAPIYWPLSTSSGSYTLWVYYHRLTDQTVFACVTDFVEPKMKEVEREIERVRGSTDKRNAREKLEQWEELLQELRDLRDELLRVAKLPYKPDLDDGVLITASPLWKLFRHAKWGKSLKECWEALESGGFDWAHLANSIWPGRVREACRRDRSVAIAHGLEGVCEARAKQTSKGKGRTRPAGNLAPE